MLSCLGGADSRGLLVGGACLLLKALVLVTYGCGGSGECDAEGIWGSAEAGPKRPALRRASDGEEVADICT